MMNVTDEIFNRMDRWRNLPNYQLERRVDLIFSIYLNRVLGERYNKGFREDLIPEFPIRTGDKDYRSFKIDYLAFTKDDSEVFMLELKTDHASRRDKQDGYLRSAAEKGLTQLVEDLKGISCESASKRKYFHLFTLLEAVGVVRLPEQLERKVFSDNMTGIRELIQKTEVIKKSLKSRIVYLQPAVGEKDIIMTQDKSHVGVPTDFITFADFADAIAKFNDPLTQRFVQSLRTWGSVKAGDLR